MAAAGNGDPHRALLLVASVEALWESLGASISIAFWDGLLERYIGPAVAVLGPDADAVRDQGRGLAFEEAVQLALCDGPS